jgi:hypothetical protein
MEEGVSKLIPNQISYSEMKISLEALFIFISEKAFYQSILLTDHICQICRFPHFTVIAL